MRISLAMWFPPFAGRIHVSPSKVQAVLNWPAQIDVHEVRSFIWLCSYYRRFVKDFGEIAAPITALTRKDAKFECTEDCQVAFDKLKRSLTSAPVLTMPHDDDPFILDTDASAFSIGAVLSQVQDGVELAYASRKMSPAELNYCVTRQELVA